MPMRRASGRASGPRAPGRPPPAPTKTKQFKLPGNSPRGDAPQTRSTDAKAVDRYKKTADYRKSIRAAYKSNSEGERQARVEHGRQQGSKASTESRAILHEHASNVARNRSLARGAAGFTGASDKDRARAEKFKQTDAYDSALRAAREARQRREAGPPEAAGITEAAIDSVLRTVPGGEIIKKVAGPTLEATYHDPIGVPTKTATAVPATIKGTIGGLAQLGMQAYEDPASLKDVPLDLGKQAVKDYSRRYGGSQQKQVKRIREEGALPEVLDATMLFGGVGAGAGRLAGSAARAGRLGSKAERLMTEARPALRTRAGEGGAAPQPASPNLFTRSVQERRDRRRDRLATERQARGNYKGLVPGDGEVVRGTRRAQGARMRKDVSGVYSRGHEQIRSVQDTEIRREGGLRGGRSRAHAGLNRQERKLFDDLQVHALQGLVHYDDPAQRFAKLHAHRAQAEAGLAAHPDVNERLPGVDAVASIDKALERAARDDVDTDKVIGRLRQFHVEEADRAKRMEATSDVRRARDAEVRRHAPVARVMGDPYVHEVAELEGRRGAAHEELAAMKHDVEKLDNEIGRAKETAAHKRGVAETRGDLANRAARNKDPEYVEARRELSRAQKKHTKAKKATRNAHSEPARADAPEPTIAQPRPKTGSIEARRYPANWTDLSNEQRRAISDESQARVARGESARLSDEEMADISRRAAKGTPAKALYSDADRARALEEEYQAHLDLEAARKNFHEVSASTDARALGLTSKAARADRGSAWNIEEHHAVSNPLRGLHRTPPAPLRNLERAQSRVHELETRKARLRQAIKDHHIPSEEEIHGLRRDAEDRMVERVKKDRGNQPAPVYVQHRPHSTKGFGNFAAGGGHAIARDRRNHFSLFDTGRYDPSPDAYEQGIARATKREVNWNTNADLLERHAPPWNEGNHRDGRIFHSVKSAKDAVLSRGLSLDDWQPVDVSLYRRLANDDLGDARTDLDARGDVNAPDVNEGQAIKAALNDAVPDGKTLNTLGDEGTFGGTQGFMIVPTAVAKEMHAQATPSGKIGRAFSKLTGATSRVILSTSPLYIPANTASNALLAGPETRGRAFTGAGRRWYKGLSPESKKMIDKWAGLDSPAFDMGRATRMGSTWDNQFVDGYHALIDSNVLRKARQHHFNPFTWNRTGDALQNNYFRREVFHDKLRRQARDNITKNANGIINELPDVMKALEMPDDDIMAKLSALREVEPQLERISELTDDILGNWTRFTAAERRALKQNVLFYGFLRFATKLTFFTMPVKHPLVTSMALKFGQLHNEEIVDLLGSELDGQGYDPEELRNTIRKEFLRDIGTRAFIKHGDHVGSFDLAKINPFGGPLADFTANPAKAFAGLASPLVQTAISAGLFGAQPVTGIPFSTRGKPTKFGDKPKMNVGDFARILGRDFLMSSPGIRALDSALSDPNVRQGDDSLPIVQDRPITPLSEADKALVKRLQRDIKPGALGRAMQTTVTSAAKSDNRALIERIETAQWKKGDERLQGQLDDLVKAKKDKIPGTDTSTREYQRIADQKSALEKRHNEFRGKVETARRQKAPLTPQEKIQQNIEKYKEHAADPAAAVNERIRKFRQKQRIQQYLRTHP